MDDDCASDDSSDDDYDVSFEALLGRFPDERANLLSDLGWMREYAREAAASGTLERLGRDLDFGLRVFNQRVDEAVAVLGSRDDVPPRDAADLRRWYHASRDDFDSCDAAFWRHAGLVCRLCSVVDRPAVAARALDRIRAHHLYREATRRVDLDRYDRETREVAWYRDLGGWLLVVALLVPRAAPRCWIARLPAVLALVLLAAAVVRQLGLLVDARDRLGARGWGGVWVHGALHGAALVAIVCLAAAAVCLSVVN